MKKKLHLIIETSIIISAFAIFAILWVDAFKDIERFWDMYIETREPIYLETVSNIYRQLFLECLILYISAYVFDFVYKIFFKFERKKIKANFIFLAGISLIAAGEIIYFILWSNATLMSQDDAMLKYISISGFGWFYVLVCILILNSIALINNATINKKTTKKFFWLNDVQDELNNEAKSKNKDKNENEDKNQIKLL
ncbi:MAG: hypothetical protein LBT30_05960 [Clostridiales bacterium]|jgi:hypothetical protein|nr:hypothetical protein [Clostridiales bacterium]